jgi:hypothetical protein
LLPSIEEEAMNANSDFRGRSALLFHGHPGQDQSGQEGVPLSRRAELASDALIAGGIVRLMNSIVNKSEIPETFGLSLLEDGIRLTKRLEKGDIYLDKRKSHLIPPPESVDTVRCIRARGTANVKDRSQEALSVLNYIRDILAQGDATDLAELDPQLVISTRAFFRVVHTSIIDQLGAFEIPSRSVHID